MKPPTEANIAGMSPSGTVRLDETFVAAAAEGRGTLGFQGTSYPFILVGTVMGPGGGADRITAAGEVYNLTSVADFGGRFTQGMSPPGIDTAQAGDLWLRNGAGVIMHLRDTSRGAILSIGRDEIFIRMGQ